MCVSWRSEVEMIPKHASPYHGVILAVVGKGSLLNSYLPNHFKQGLAHQTRQNLVIKVHISNKSEHKAMKGLMPFSKDTKVIHASLTGGMFL